MPVATVNHSFERHELKSCEGAYVMLRPLPYGLKLERRDKAMKMKLEQEVTPRRGRQRKRGNEPEIQKIELEQFSSWSTQFDFSHCIGEHNLTDENGTPLDLGNPMTLQFLDPKIGSELEDLLAEINGDLDDGEMDRFTSQPAPSSSTELTQ